MNYPFTASEESISVFFAGSMRSIPSTDSGFAELSAHLKGGVHDYATIEALVDKPTMIRRLTEGKVAVVGNTVYHKGSPVHTTLAEKLVYLLEEGYDAKPWARFMDRVMQNPSERSRGCLFDFLSVWDAPIDTDGCFIAFKRVTDDYKDFYTQTFDNSPGADVSIPREKVNDDPDVKCSYGLHVAASSYLGHYHGSSGRVVACRVAPEDVVAVPSDYGFAKMRVCAYTVLGDAEESFVNNAHTCRMYEPEPAATAEHAEAEDSIDYDVFDEEDPYCGDCGMVPVDFEDELCETCENVELDHWRSDCDAQTKFLREEESIAETGCTSDGVPVEESYISYYGAGHNVKRFTDGDYGSGVPSPATDDSVDEEPSEMSFTRAGVTYWASQIAAGVAEHGQRAFAKMTGVPRSTIQEWLKKINGPVFTPDDSHLF